MGTLAIIVRLLVTRLLILLLVTLLILLLIALLVLRLLILRLCILRLLILGLLILRLLVSEERSKLGHIGCTHPTWHSCAPHKRVGHHAIGHKLIHSERTQALIIDEKIILVHNRRIYELII